MNTYRRYDTMDNQCRTLSQIFEQSLQNKDVPEMIMLLGMMPLEDIKLDALLQWKDVGYDLILHTRRLHDHPVYANFVRTHFCEACRELNLEQIQRFISYASESDQLEGFLFVLLENVNRSERTFPTTEKSISLDDLMRNTFPTDKRRPQIIEFLIEQVSVNVLEQASKALNFDTTVFPQQQMYHNNFWTDAAQKIQHQILKQAAEDAASDHTSENSLKRKM